MMIDGNRVREARDQAQLTQQELSIAASGLGIFVSQTRISHIETGRVSDVHELEATILAAVLTKPLSFLLPHGDLTARAEQAAKLLAEAQDLLADQET